MQPVRASFNIPVRIRCNAKKQPGEQVSGLPFVRTRSVRLMHHMADNASTAPQQNGRATDPKHRNNNRWHMSLLLS